MAEVKLEKMAKAKMDDLKISNRIIARIDWLSARYEFWLNKRRKTKYEYYRSCARKEMKLVMEELRIFKTFQWLRRSSSWKKMTFKKKCIVEWVTQPMLWKEWGSWQEWFGHKKGPSASFLRGFDKFMERFSAG